MKSKMLVAALILASATLCAAPESVRNVRWLPLTEIEKDALDNPSGKIHNLPLWFTPYNILRPRVPVRTEIFGDRKVYLTDDTVGQFLVYFTGADISAPGTKMTVELLRDDKPVLTREMAPVLTPKAAFLLDTGALSAGDYRIRARLTGRVEKVTPDYAFAKSKERHRAVAFPRDGVPLLVHGQEIDANAEWPITTGIPLPRATADTTDRFVLLEDGKAVAAQFSTRATWMPDGSQIKWMGLSFLARYQDGKPRDYRLTLLPEGRAAQPPATALKVTESPEAFTVDTGKVRFIVNRKAFAGISRAWAVNADGSVGDPVVIGDGGPYLIDERGARYEAANDELATVELAERGPVRAVIYATGWYVCKRNAERLCQFRTEIKASAGQAAIDVAQRTIITYDTDKQKLADLGFAVRTAETARYAFGVDGKALSGEMPAPVVDPKTKKAGPAPTVWMLQDRWNHCRLVNAAPQAAEGAKSDGWALASGKAGVAAVALRNVWQLYPKELEVARDALSVHFWPAHGAQTYTEQEELEHRNLYKFFYCHQGRYLDLKFPQKYYEGARAVCGPMLEQQDVNAIAANGQGLAISNDFQLTVQSALPPEAAARSAALYQRNPHAIADPAWNGRTEAEGRFAAADPKRFANVEKALDMGYRQNTTTPDILAEYGMWIWPDTHNNWSPVAKLPEWHRIWNLSHYQNVWEGWLLYLRSGSVWTLDWARNNTAHYMDVGTVNYDDPLHRLQGHIKGAMYHTKGLLPWGSPIHDQECGDDYVECGAHFINPDAFIISYLVMGDRRGLELMRAWGRSLDRVALPPERSREQAVTIGELFSYYTTTWDPQALVHLSDLTSEYLSQSCRANGFGFYHSQYIRRYWELTRDPALRRWTEEAWASGIRAYQVAALMYEWTGDRKYLTEMMPGISTLGQLFYDNPQDPLHGYGPRLGDLGSGRFAQRAPYFLQACLDAGIEAIPVDESRAAPVAKVTAIKKATTMGVYNTWIDTGKTQYYGEKTGWLMPRGAEPVAALEFTCVVWTNNHLLPQGTGTVYLRVENADGKALFDGQLLGGSLRPSVTVTLDPRADKGPWKVVTNGYDPTFKWTGAAEELVIGPTREAVMQQGGGK